MANIQNDINQISTARYGKEVRGSIVNALTLMNEESSEAMEKAVTSQESALESARIAEDAAERAIGATPEGYEALRTNVSDLNTSVGELNTKSEKLNGGNTNQILSKKSDSDYDYEWVDNEGGSGAGLIEITEAEYLDNKEFYDASDNAYVIKDVGKELDANDVAYEQTTVKAKLDNIDAEIGQINTDLEWKYYNGVSSTEEITLPENYNELHIQVHGLISYQFHFPKIVLLDAPRQYRSGFYSSQSSSGDVAISISLTKAKLELNYLNGSNVTESSYLHIYYR